MSSVPARASLRLTHPASQVFADPAVRAAHTARLTSLLLDNLVRAALATRIETTYLVFFKVRLQR